MSKFYSKTTGGFYAAEIHGAGMPSDAVEISDQVHAELLDAQAKGQVIVADADGKPIATDRPGPTPAQVAALLSMGVQGHVDAAARALGYDSILAAITYADEPSVPQYQAEGAALRAWRSQVWAAAAPLIAGGKVSSVDALLKKLPKFTPPTA